MILIIFQFFEFCGSKSFVNFKITAYKYDL